MKKFLLSFVLGLLMTSAVADEYPYPYLVLTSTSGEQTAVAVDGLEMTFSDGKLVAKNVKGSQTLTLADLVSMQFSEGIDLPDGIAEIQNSTSADGIIYDLQGRRIPSPLVRKGAGAASKGIFIVKQNGGTHKVYVK